MTRIPTIILETKKLYTTFLNTIVPLLRFIGEKGGLSLTMSLPIRLHIFGENTLILLLRFRM